MPLSATGLLNGMSEQGNNLVALLCALPKGVDPSSIWARWVTWMLIDPVYGVIHNVKDRPPLAVITNAANLYGTGGSFEEVEMLKHEIRVLKPSLAKAAWAGVWPETKPGWALDFLVQKTITALEGSLDENPMLVVGTASLVREMIEGGERLRDNENWIMAAYDKLIDLKGSSNVCTSDRL